MPFTTPKIITDLGESRVVTALVVIGENENVLSVAGLRLKEDGNNVPCVFTVGSRWKNLPSVLTAPLKDVYVTFQQANAETQLTVTDDNSGVIPAFPNPLVVTENANDIVINNGLIQATINKTANGTNLFTQFSRGGTELLDAVNKVQLSIPVPKKTSVTHDSQYEFGAIAGSNTVKVANAGLFSVGDSVKYGWTGIIESYLSTGGFNGAAVINLIQPVSLLDIGAGAAAAQINLIINPGGSQQIITLRYLGSGQIHLDSIPGVTPLPGQLVRIQSVEAEPTKVIQAIDLATNTLTFTTNHVGVIPQGVDLAPAVAVNISAFAAVKAAGTTISKQFGNGNVVIEQKCILYDTGSSARLFNTLEFWVYWHFFANKEIVVCDIIPINRHTNPALAECADIYINAMKLSFKTNVVATAVADEVLTEALSVTRYKANTYHSSVSHSGIANLKLAAPYFSSLFPKRVEVTAAGEFIYHLFPDTGTPHRIKGSSAIWTTAIFGTNADLYHSVTNSIGVHHDAAQLTAAKAIRPNVIEKRNWTTEFAGDPNPLLAVAAERYERLAAGAYDLSANEQISGSRIAQTIDEYRTEYAERRPGMHVVGWERFGNLAWDNGLNNNHYDIPYALLREASRISDISKAKKAVRIGLENLRNRCSLGQYHSHKFNNGNPEYNFFGMARYEQLNGGSTDVFSNRRPPTRSHTWNDGTFLGYRLTQHPFLKFCAESGIFSALQWNYQGSVGARRGGTGSYDLKDPNTGGAADEIRSAGWPILTLIDGYRTFGDPALLVKAQEYCASFVATQNAETPNDGYLSVIIDGLENPLFQWTGYAMHGIIETWRESVGATKTSIGTLIARVANFLYKGDQRSSGITPDRPILVGADHPTDPTKYAPGVSMAFHWKRSFADTLSTAIAAGATSMPLNDASSFDYGLGYNGTIACLMPNQLDPSTWRYFTFAKSGNSLINIVPMAGQTIPAAAAGTVVYPMGIGGGLNDVVVATLIAGARITGAQQLQDMAESIWVDNVLYNDYNPTDFVTKGQYNKINFWPGQYGGSGPKLWGQRLTALSEFLGDRLIPQPIPTIATITPQAVAVGAGATLVTVTGINYDLDAKIFVNGVQQVTTYVNATTLSATLAASNFTAVGDLAITITNPASGNVSSAATIAVRIAPVIASLFPNTKVAGDPAFLLTVNGTGFDANCQVLWNGSPRTSNFVSATQMTAQINAPDVATAGTIQVRVINSLTGLQSANSAFTINPPVGVTPAPSVSSLSPISAVQNAAGFTLIINGANFPTDSVARWNGADKVTARVSANQLTIPVVTADLATVGTIPITVFSPTTGVSTPVQFTVTPASVATPPSISGLSPISANQNGGGFTLTVNGANFPVDSVVRWNGADKVTARVSANQLTIPVVTGDLTAAGAIPITVFSPSTGLSSAVSFTVIAPSGGGGGGGGAATPIVYTGSITIKGTTFTGANFKNPTVQLEIKRDRAVSTSSGTLPAGVATTVACTYANGRLVVPDVMLNTHFNGTTEDDKNAVYSATFIDGTTRIPMAGFTFFTLRLVTDKTSWLDIAGANHRRNRGELYGGELGITNSLELFEQQMNEVASKIFVIGSRSNLADDDSIYIYAGGSTNGPFIRYNAASNQWEISHNGVTVLPLA